MTWLKTIGGELWSLFVDDGLLAILALCWLAVLALGHSLLAPGLPKSGWAGGLMAAGLILILAESVLRAARKARAMNEGVGR